MSRLASTRHVLHHIRRHAERLVPPVPITWLPQATLTYRRCGKRGRQLPEVGASDRTSLPPLWSRWRGAADGRLAYYGSARPRGSDRPGNRWNAEAPGQPASSRRLRPRATSLPSPVTMRRAGSIYHLLFDFPRPETAKCAMAFPLPVSSAAVDFPRKATCLLRQGPDVSGAADAIVGPRRPA